MPTFSALPPVRDDFRCSLCRQKQAFHCEHDTPYRDQLLGTYEQRYTRSDKHRRSSHRTNSSDNKTSKPSKSAPGQSNGNPNSNPKYQQGNQLQTNSTNSTRTYEQKKKNKSCVIL